jgi:hypothetical protein
MRPHLGILSERRQDAVQVECLHIPNDPHTTPAPYQPYLDTYVQCAT